MRYLENGRFQLNPLMRLTLAGSLVFLAGLWMTGFGMYFSRLGLAPSSVVAYYRGSEETFQPARTFGSMVEVTHGHMAMMALVLLLLTHLAVFVPASRRFKLVLIFGTFGSALVDEAAGWLVRFVHPGFAILKPAAFLSAQAFQLVLLGALGTFLWRAARADLLREREEAVAGSGGASEAAHDEGEAGEAA